MTKNILCGASLLMLLSMFLLVPSANAGQFLWLNIGEGAPNFVGGVWTIDPWKDDPDDPGYEYTDHYLTEPVDSSNTILVLSRYELKDWRTFKYSLVSDEVIRFWRYAGNDVAIVQMYLIDSPGVVTHDILRLDVPKGNFNVYIEPPIPFDDVNDLVVNALVVGKYINGRHPNTPLRNFRVIRPILTPEGGRIQINGKAQRAGTVSIPVQIIDLTGDKE